MSASSETSAESKTDSESLRISRKASGTPLTFESFEMLLTTASAKRNPSDMNRCEALRKAKITYMQHA